MLGIGLFYWFFRFQVKTTTCSTFTKHSIAKKVLHSLWLKVCIENIGRKVCPNFAKLCFVCLSSMKYFCPKLLASHCEHQLPQFLTLIFQSFTFVEKNAIKCEGEGPKGEKHTIEYIRNLVLLILSWNTI